MQAKAAHPLIVEVYPSGYAAGGADQFIRLHNPAHDPVDLGGWSLGGLKQRALFPPGVRIAPGHSLYAARSTNGFARVMGFAPDAVWGAEEGVGPHRMMGAAELLLARAEGLLVLRGPSGLPVDQVAWGDPSGRQALGWRGGGVPAPLAGEVLHRARAEASWTGSAPGDYLPDSDSAADWRQGADWVSRRVLRPGQTLLPYPTFPAESVTAYTSPDTSYQVLSSLLAEAREQIDINIYSFTNPLVAERLVEAGQRGVRVRLLIEAAHLGSLDDQVRLIAQMVQGAGGQVRWILNQPGAGIYGRYVFNHAKYGVVDGRAVFVQSENLGKTGTPSDPSAGNRGWGVVVREPRLARYMTQVFEADWYPGHGDIFPYQEEGGSPFGPPSPGAIPDLTVPTGSYPHPFPALTVDGPIPVTPVLAPDHALLESKGITGLIRGAQRSILVEQLYIHAYWGPKSGSPERTPNLFLTELIAAAWRGVRVRILLADSYVDPSAPRDNAWTAAYLNRLASQEGLDLQARLMRSEVARVEKLHNKGLVVDGERVLISSINWSYNSPANNREVGLILEHRALADFYSDVFAYDWYNGWPADYPLITEANALAGYVELSLFAPQALDLGGWRLETSAGPVRLPAGSRLAPGRPLILAQSKANFAAQFGAYPDLVELPDLALAPERDRLELWHGPDLVDRIAWGGGLPGWTLSGRRSLCRNPAGQDTNTYLDWLLRTAPSPGAPGCGR